MVLLENCMPPSPCKDCNRPVRAVACFRANCFNMNVARRPCLSPYLAIFRPLVGSRRWSSQPLSWRSRCTAAHTRTLMPHTERLAHTFPSMHWPLRVPSENTTSSMRATPVMRRNGALKSAGRFFRHRGNAQDTTIICACSITFFIIEVAQKPVYDAINSLSIHLSLQITKTPPEPVSHRISPCYNVLAYQV